MKSHRQIRTPFILLLVFWLPLSGCVYYNTFYNARRIYRTAEKARLEAKANPANRLAATSFRGHYLNAIARASVVLDLHPGSKWVDDSLLLIGKAYYWREEYDDALLKFRELQTNFPASQLMGSPSTGKAWR